MKLFIPSLVGADFPSSYQKVLAALEEKECRRQGENSWRCPVPEHEGNNPSLSVGRGDDGRVLLFCQAGCETEDVLKALDLQFSDLYPDEEPTHAEDYQIAAEYIYQDESQEPLSKVTRRECRALGDDPCPAHGKRFRQSAYIDGK